MPDHDPIPDRVEVPAPARPQAARFRAGSTPTARGGDPAEAPQLGRLRLQQLLDWVAWAVEARMHDGSTPCVVLDLGTLVGRCDNVPPTAWSVAEAGTCGYLARGGKIVATTAVVHSPRLWR